MFIPSIKVHNEYGDFDSTLEWKCYEQKILPFKNSGEYFNVLLHTTYEIIPKLIKKVTIQLKTKTKVVERVVEHNASYTCDFQYSINTDNGEQIHIVEFKSKFSAKDFAYTLRRKLIRMRIAEWNEKEGWEKFVFHEYKESDLELPPKKPRKKKEQKSK